MSDMREHFYPERIKDWEPSVEADWALGVPRDIAAEPIVVANPEWHRDHLYSIARLIDVESRHIRMATINKNQHDMERHCRWFHYHADCYDTHLRYMRTGRVKP